MLTMRNAFMRFVTDPQAPIPFIGHLSKENAIKLALSGMQAVRQTNLLKRCLQALHYAQQQIAQLSKERDHYKELASKDSLTGLFNRHMFMQILDREFARVERYGVGSALIYVDLDFFKNINDVHGHPAADAALELFGKKLRNEGRSSDSFGRLGGDEFAIILTETTPENAKTALDRYQKILGNLSFSWEEQKITFGASLGLAIYNPDTMKGVNDFLSAADAAMYAVKDAKKTEMQKKLA